MAGPSVSDWERNEAVIRANVRGFNALRELPILLAKEYSWAKEYKFGFCDKDEIPEWRSKGWGHVRMEWLDTGADTLNRALPLRFGITDDGAGNVRWRDNWLMLMPLTLRKEVVDARNRASEEAFASAVQNQRYVADGDARGDSESSFEERTVRTAPTESPKKKRGRPPKNKE